MPEILWREFKLIKFLIFIQEESFVSKFSLSFAEIILIFFISSTPPNPMSERLGELLS